MILVHSAYRKLREVTNFSPGDIIETLKEVITPEGSIIMPVFTYCFRKKNGTNEVFDTSNSKSKTGYLTEMFRLSDGVTRTNSPTHSFAIWGKLNSGKQFVDNPESPLGRESVLTSLLRANGKILMLGCGFESFTFGHYLENLAPAPWKDISPWDYMGVEPAGVSVDGETKLKELPGCSRGFLSFEKYLLEKRSISKKNFAGLSYYSLDANDVYNEGLIYFSKFPDKLICAKGSCQPCDSRRQKLKEAGVIL